MESACIVSRIFFKKIEKFGAVTTRKERKRERTGGKFVSCEKKTILNKTVVVDAGTSD